MSDPLEDLARALHEVPAVVHDAYLDVLASNDLARRLTAAFEPGTNIARFTFLNPVVPRSTTTWDQVARTIAGALRAASPARLDDPAFRALVGELAAHSDDFNRAWAAAESQPPTAGFQMDHPVVGPLHLTWVELVVPDSRSGRVLTVWRPDDATTAQRLHALRTARPFP
ncbi:hypothetical protein [Kineococcus rhizosphaerae]|uniref:MmyB-like transcription regulator ligand binding domain-containing protein n=1 Tax=Kineococcus rhizosphaerae TaxID=559628 RepID=A0A2T0R3T5_9ACTN|nr:hypothetical protein [Kineococcus rhizosphaerae]PRY14653.1 hypothetical protein CLV37_106212 [Kineococcus rhizosphaerae]